MLQAERSTLSEPNMRCSRCIGLPCAGVRDGCTMCSLVHNKAATRASEHSQGTINDKQAGDVLSCCLAVLSLGSASQARQLHCCISSLLVMKLPACAKPASDKLAGAFATPRLYMTATALRCKQD